MNKSFKFLECYAKLIEIPTISSLDERLDLSNKTLIELLANWLDALGFDVEITAVIGSRKKYNLCATLGKGKGGLLLSGHTDTVPFDEGKWRFDPFKLTEHNGKLYGLGTADMKGFFAFVIDAINQLDLTKLKRPLHILATADEEITMSGARMFVKQRKINPDFAIIGEPTSLQPIRAHKGHFAQSVRITGQSAHSSDPSKGVNAIELMYEVIESLYQLRSELQQKYHNPLFEIPYPTLNLGKITGGDAVNRVCSCCELQLDIRPIPQLSLETLNELLHMAIFPLNEKWLNRIGIHPLHQGISGYECPDSAELVQVVEGLLGEKSQAVNYCTEASFIQQLCPTLIIGPGSIAQAHQIDEYLSMNFIQPTQRLLLQLIHHFCY